MTCLLAAAGLRAVLVGAPPASGARGVAQPVDLAAQGLAERFARAYLEYDPDRPELRERALAALAVDDASGLSPLLSRRPAAVRWAAVVGDRRRGSTHQITVATQTTQGLVHLTIPIARRARGLLAVAGPPAVVGEPPRAPRAIDVAERSDPVEDRALQVIAERVVRNYLAGERRNLAADLSPRAVVSMPAQAYVVDSVEQSTWVARGRAVAVDVQVSEQEGGGRVLLRYELGVARREGRWQVTAIGSTSQPNQGEVR